MASVLAATTALSFSGTALRFEELKLPALDQLWQRLMAFGNSGSLGASEKTDADCSSSTTLSAETVAYLTNLLGEAGSTMMLYQTALTHRSFVHNPATQEPLESNQRLEFLGDSVLGLLVSDYLFRNFPASAEGELSSTRAKIVNSRSLAGFARTLSLGNHIILGELPDHQNIRGSESALADAFESLIGAIYLDKGLQKAYDFIIRHIIEHVNFNSIVAAEHNYKSRLIEYTQSHHLPPPLYALLAEAGAEHAKTFTVTVSCNEELLGRGTARRKKDAEQLAAKEAMERIEEQRASMENA
jgi:ribonuclease-3